MKPNSKKFEKEIKATQDGDYNEGVKILPPFQMMAMKMLNILGSFISCNNIFFHMIFTLNRFLVKIYYVFKIYNRI